MTENELLIDCLQRLNQCGVPYMLTGSMASNYWGIPRSTHDLDFVVQLKAEHVSALVAAFAGIISFKKVPFVVRWGRPINSTRSTTAPL